MRNLAALLGSVLAICAAAQAHADESDLANSKLPLYDAFNAFCVETESVPAEVKAVIEGAGGMPASPPEKRWWPTLTDPQSWEITVGGHLLKVSVERSELNAAADIPGVDACVIDSLASEADSISAIGKWVGVPAYLKEKDAIYYAYQEQGGKRREGDLYEPGHWHLSIVHSPAVTLELQHWLP